MTDPAELTTPDRETIEGLIARLEKAEGPDRELDAAIWCAIGSTPPQTLDSALRGDPIDPLHEIMGVTMQGYIDRVHDFLDAGKAWKAPRLTASLDAAVALVERMLPGWWWDVCTYEQGKYEAFVNPPDYKNPDESPCGIGIRPSPATALCLALLRAILARTEPALPEVGEKETTHAR